MNITTIGFDADDTLWHNERFYVLTQERFADLLADYTDRASLDARLQAAERRNIGHYGYGIKGFVLSMIETAVDVTDARVPAAVIRRILEIGQEMLRHPIELLPDAHKTVAAMAASRHRLVLITKGDLLDQERKLAESGLWEYFDAVEIVSEKSAAVYRRIFNRHGDGPERAMMVGNSMKSDVLPAIEAGAWAVHVPFELVWALESAPAPTGHERYRVLDGLGGLKALVDWIG
ncbi:HAD family hydrolase [Tropicimonas sp.]|uniref:HAD family hydrolase n=1 Tax=Tropicimonas sp. TaxID=2067044 RepID=UPI003A8AAAB0